MNDDRIEKKLLLKAPLSRVWRALADAQEFGHWFGVTFNGPFTTGAKLKATLVGTQVNAEVAKAQRTHEGLTFDFVIEEIQPQKLFSFRWHPNATDRENDYSAEPMTLVSFTLEEVPAGVMLTLVESGFDKLPLERRTQAFTSNDGGWAIMTKVFQEHLEPTALRSK